MRKGKFFIFFLLALQLSACHIFNTDFKDGKNTLKWTLDSLSKPFIGDVIYDENIPYITVNKKQVQMLQIGTTQKFYLKIVNPRKLKLNMDIKIKDAGNFLTTATPNLNITDKDTWTEAAISFTLKKEADKKNLEIVIIPEKEDGVKLEQIELSLRINQRPEGVSRYNGATLLAANDIWKIDYDSSAKTATIRWDIKKGEFDTDIKNIKVVSEKNGIKNKEELLSPDAKEYSLKNVTPTDKIKFFISVIDDEGLESYLYISGEKEENIFAGGTGTSDDPYLIATAKQLDQVRNFPEASFLQIADVDLSVYENWSPIENFKGRYNGGNYKIENLKIKRADEEGDRSIGLFGSVFGGIELKNIKMVNVNILVNLNSEYVGALVGKIMPNGEEVETKIEGCSIVSGDVYGNDQLIGLGGIVGGTESIISLQISKCWNGATLHCNGISTYIGGLVGFLNGYCKIEKSYNLCSFTINTSSASGGLVGKLVGTAKDSQIFYCYSLIPTITVGAVTRGGIVGEVDKAKLKIGNSYFLENGDINKTLEIVGKKIEPSSIVVEKCFFKDAQPINWYTDGEALESAGLGDQFIISDSTKNVHLKDNPQTLFYDITTLFSGGLGKSTSPYKISNRADLEKIDSVGIIGASYHFIQTKDIDLSASNWNCIGFVTGEQFRGTYDGAFKKISNMKIVETQKKDLGLFAGIDGATLQNVFIRDATIISNCNNGSNPFGMNGSRYEFTAAGLVGASSNSTVKNCSVFANITVNYNGHGSTPATYARKKIFGAGIIGYATGTTVENCYSNIFAKVEDGENAVNDISGVAGILGKANTVVTIKNCHTFMKIEAVAGVKCFFAGILHSNQQQCKILNSYSLTATSPSGADLYGLAVHLGNYDSVAIKNSFSNFTSLYGNIGTDLFIRENCFSKPSEWFKGEDSISELNKDNDGVWLLKTGYLYPQLRDNPYMQ